MKIEYCFHCDEQTGKAGRDEDSLYTPDGYGPYCEDCWANLCGDDKEQE